MSAVCNVVTVGVVSSAVGSPFVVFGFTSVEVSAGSTVGSIVSTSHSSVSVSGGSWVS